MNLKEFVFGKPKKKKPKKKPQEEEIEEVKVEEPEENLDLEDEDVKQIAEEVRPKKAKKPLVKAPKGKALIDVNRRSYLHLALGAILTLVNIAILIVATVGWMQIIEEKILVFMYAVPSIYVTGKFTWIMIQGKQVEDEDIE